MGATTLANGRAPATTSCVGHLVAHAARRWGSRPMLHVVGEESFGFAEIDALAARFAGGLAGLGVAPGDRVVLHLPTGWRWVVAYHALARMGAVVVPANIVLSADELRFMLDHSGARLAIVEPARAESVHRQAQVIVTQPDAIPGLANAIAFDGLLQATPRLQAALSPDMLFTIGYTSGTTGRPKGAMLTQGGIHAAVAHTATIHVRHDGDRVFSALPLPHVYGNVVMNACFLAGAALHAQTRFDADAALRMIAAERITLFEGVPTMYYQMLGSPLLAGADLSSLTRCTVGGQTMPLAKLDAVAERFGCPVLELWGMTELGGPATSHSPYWPARHASIGLPFPGTEIRLAGPDPQIQTATGDVGEMMVRGELVMSGYWNDPAATAEVFADGWFATGDIARRAADGSLTIIDRKKEVILTSGYNVYPAEVEQAIAAFPGVVMVGVSGAPDESKGEIVRAFVVQQSGAEVQAADLVAHCRRTLAAYKVPRAIFFVDDLPRTATGKIMRRALNALPCAAT